MKRTERLSLYEAMGQAERDAGDDCPLVLHRRNGRQWLFVGSIEDLIDISQSATLTVEHL